MMLSDRDPNGGGRTSRASNMSAMSRTSGRNPHGAPKSDLFSSAGPGVTSMLRTSTEMGNLHGLTNRMSGVSNMPGNAQRRGASSRMSTTSSVSNHSGRTSRHHPRYPSSSSAPRYSMGREQNMPQYIADTLSPTVMNIPGSSPLVPTGSRNRDSYRSQSMTHAMQPPYSLTSNRSLNSLRPPRPHSPYNYPNHYQTRLRKPSYRPASPALSDITGARPRHSYGYDGQVLPCASQGQQYGRQEYPYPSQGQRYAGHGHPHNLGQMRLRIPSDPLIDTGLDWVQEGTDKMRSALLHPKRKPPQTIAREPAFDAPALPPQYQHRIAIEQARMKGSTQGSVSSGSTNLRADSDPPSSDMASPPTPKDGTSMEVHHTLNGTQLIIDHLGPDGIVINDGVTGGYYDGSEQFDREQFAELNADPVPTGFGSRIKSITEEYDSPEQMPEKSFLIKRKVSVEVVRLEVPSIAELPASPVARRITRELIRKGLESASSSENVGSSVKSRRHEKDDEATQSDDLPSATNSTTDELAEASLHPADQSDNRHSIMSKADSTAFNSSTLEFAVYHSIPAATNGGFQNDLAPEPHDSSNSPANPERSTDDGMSDVLAGYQGSDSKHETSAMSQSELTLKKERNLDEHTGDSTEADLKLSTPVARPKCNHVQKSSDEQSFKSCTDLPEAESGTPTPKAEKGQDGNSFRSGPEVLPGHNTYAQEPSAGSFATAKFAASPDRASSIPSSLLPSSHLGTLVMNRSRTNFEKLPSKPPATLLRKQPKVPDRESSFSIITSKLRASSKPSIKHGSLSVSESLSALSLPHLPPAIPLRESSTSKEAQRLQEVVSSLVRSARFKRGPKRIVHDDTPATDGIGQSDCESTHDTQSTSALVDVKTPEKALVRSDSVSPRTPRAVSFDPRVNCNPSKDLGNKTIPAAHRQSYSSPSQVIPETSSVYSPQDTPQNRVHPLPAGVPAATDPNRRDSQTTTHLDWHHHMAPVAPKGLHETFPRPANGVGPHLNPLPPLTNIQEDTTTDLRLSGYVHPGYAGPSRYLPDLKEESHEDSSLNTSASNLKNSNFRFPFGLASNVRASGEDPINFSQRSSMASQRRSVVGSAGGSALAQAHALPSMRFSQMNLFDGLTNELGLRCSRSMEEVPNAPQRLNEGSPPRPASADDVLRLSLAELDDMERSRGSMHPTTMMNLFAMHRARSPELMAEIEKLTIPEVGGLTQRFSEWFPGLRDYYNRGQDSEFPEEEALEKHALEEIQEIHPAQKRSSARLRPLRGVSHMVVIDDDLYEDITGKEKEEGGPGHQGDGVAESGASGMASIAEQGEDLTNAATRRNTSPFPELQIPSPVVLRPRSHTVDPQGFRTSGDSALSSRRSLRSFVSSPTTTETRPWNSDKNYPWATATNPAIDISLPPPTATRHSPRPGPSNLRNRLSDASTASSFSTAQTATTSPFGSPPDSNSHARQHRFSAFGRSGSQAHAVGERYPTSALSPPTAIFRDHLSASDISDDEHYDTTHKTRLSIRKRFSSTRNVTLDGNSRVTRSKIDPQELASPESTKQSTASFLRDRACEAQAFTATANRHTFCDAEGMKPVAYRKHRIIARFKKWWQQGNNFVRHLSRRNTSESTTL